MTATALQNSLYPSFGVINSFSIYEYKDTEYEEYALSVLRLANDNLSQSIAHFWKLPFTEKEINYHLLSKLEPLLKVLQKITLLELSTNRDIIRKVGTIKRTYLLEIQEKIKEAIF